MSELPKELREGRFVSFRKLGEGAQGDTFEGVDRQLGKPVTLKRFQVRGAKSWKDVELAEREAFVLKTLSHPTLPKYVDHFEEDGALYLVTERIEGESLFDLRSRGVRMSEQEVYGLLHELARTFDYLHGRNPPIVHRDIKPSNVLKRSDGTYALIDFGSVHHRMRAGEGSTVVGTFGYMAPEQFQGRALPASDVYALGVTLLSLLTGIAPEDLPHKGLAIDVRTALSGFTLSPRLVETIAKMVEPDPDRRPSSLSALLAEPKQELPKERSRSDSSRQDDERKVEDFLRRVEQRGERDRMEGKSRARKSYRLLVIVLLGSYLYLKFMFGKVFWFGWLFWVLFGLGFFVFRRRPEWVRRHKHRWKENLRELLSEAERRASVRPEKRSRRFSVETEVSEVDHEDSLTEESEEGRSPRSRRPPVG